MPKVIHSINNLLGGVDREVDGICNLTHGRVDVTFLTVFEKPHHPVAVFILLLEGADVVPGPLVAHVWVLVWDENAAPVPIIKTSSVIIIFTSSMDATSPQTRNGCTT